MDQSAPWACPTVGMKEMTNETAFLVRVLLALTMLLSKVWVQISAAMLTLMNQAALWSSI
jgi:hypothetical protein